MKIYHVKVKNDSTIHIRKGIRFGPHNTTPCLAVIRPVPCRLVLLVSRTCSQCSLSCRPAYCVVTAGHFDPCRHMRVHQCHLIRRVPFGKAFQGFTEDLFSDTLAVDSCCQACRCQRPAGTLGLNHAHAVAPHISSCRPANHISICHRGPALFPQTHNTPFSPFLSTPLICRVGNILHTTTTYTVTAPCQADPSKEHGSRTLCVTTFLLTVLQIASVLARRV